ncbi:MAG: aminotransferase class V-fold PLP-dependent enzyme [Nitrospirales bacterium]|nr:aminotransferase class V-fold PLP-dependent enzyme [Nitrospirales bacterium]MBA3966051.1 aminotransferase class V-fold PLP-dependent enzyme [Nitrospirales bacterium]
MIYLNPAGLAPFHHDVQQEISRTLETFSHLLYAEAGIQHYRDTLQRCRRTIADWLTLNDEQRLAFLPNTTTACSLVLSRINWKPGNAILTTTHENSTILNEIEKLRDRGVRIITLDPDAPSGFLPALERTLDEQPVQAIVISHVSHFDGRIFPITTIQDLAQSHHTQLIVDGAQAIGHIPVSFQEISPYAYFFPGHKWCTGPMGTGALIIGKDGHQETQPYWAGYELGTQNIGLIAGFAKACHLKAQTSSNNQILEEFREEWKVCLRPNPGIRTIEWDGPHAPGILSFVCLDEPTEQTMHTLSTTQSLAWKTLTHPSYPSNLSIRVSWTTDTPGIDIRSTLALFTSLSNE